MSNGTRTVADGWFQALTGGDIGRALGCPADDVEWVNYTPVPGYNDAMTWIAPASTTRTPRCLSRPATAPPRPSGAGGGRRRCERHGAH